MSDTPELLAAKRWVATPAGKAMAILVLALAMQIPLLMVSGLIQERQARQNEVLTTFRRGWGAEQTLVGPMLMVPYSWTNKDGNGARQHGWARLPASRLHLVASLQPEERRRGLFHAIVYKAAVEMAGTITVPQLALPELPDLAVNWRGTRVVIGTSDVRGIQADTPIDWNGKSVPLQSSDIWQCGFSLLQAAAPLDAQPDPGSAIPFRTSLTLRGTQAFRVVPVAGQIVMRITSPWPTPSFAGATLPLGYDVRPTRFDASWEMPGDASAAGWQSGAPCGNPLWTEPDAQVGVALQEAVPTYLMVDRTAKYANFFLVLAYLTLFLFEALSGARIHLVQYGLVGLSLSLFPLLLISIAEPWGFAVSYLLSAVAVLAQASLYTWAVVARSRLAGIFAGALGALFAFIYVVLSLDAYALLVGTVCLFVALSVVMLVTKRVTWAQVQPAT